MSKIEILEIIINTANKYQEDNNFIPVIESVIYEFADELRKAVKEAHDKLEDDDIKVGLND